MISSNIHAVLYNNDYVFKRLFYYFAYLLHQRRKAFSGKKKEENGESIGGYAATIM